MSSLKFVLPPRPPLFTLGLVVVKFKCVAAQSDQTHLRACFQIAPPM